MQAKELMDGLMAEFQRVAQTETVVGEPMTIGDTTLIPVIRISIGVGAGGGEGEGGDAKEQGKGSGVGGGGGVRVEPAAFIVLKGDDVQILSAPGKGGRFAEMFENLPDLVSKVAKARNAKEDTKDEEDTANKAN